jgi:hypothetical protein
VADRDPRINPAPGDVLTNGQRTFYVTRVDGYEVFYTEDQPPVPELSVGIAEWRLYSATDRIVATADTGCAEIGEVGS